MATPPSERHTEPFRPYENLSSVEWGNLIDRLYQHFPQGRAVGMLPPHFLKSTFPKIGGQIAHFEKDHSEFWGLLLPGTNQEGAQWTIRSYWKGDTKTFQDEVENSLTTQLYTLGFGSGSWYNVEEKRNLVMIGETLKDFGTFQLGYPNLAQAKEAQAIHQEVWNVQDPAYLYPFDLYRQDAGLPTRLIATVNEQVIGFLFGFYARGTQWTGQLEQNYVWIESQLMGIQEMHRRQGFGKQLKLLQREQALRENISLIHWTFDPLQAGNAFLNLNELAGIVVHFYPNYYPFQNELNCVPASRVGVSWFLASDRVITATSGKLHHLTYQQLHNQVDTRIIIPVDDSKQVFDSTHWNPNAQTILIQIPNNWTAVQNQQLDLAQLWRQATDAIFEKILGPDDNKYALTGIVNNPSTNEVFLVAQKSPRRFV